MKMWTTEQVAKLAGAPYRQLLRWVEAGWFEPAGAGGKERKYFFFDEAGLWEIRWFEKIRHRFHPREWPAVAKAIHQMRVQGSTTRYIAGVQESSGKKSPIEYRPVQEADIAGLVAAGVLIVLVALGIEALASGRD
jgi:hypothetical protein